MNTAPNPRPDELLIVWTSGDRDVARNMVLMYAKNAQRLGWWREVNLLIWGPSQKLLTEDDELQMKLRVMLDLGVRVRACKACADNYQIAEELEDLGVEVFYSGEFLTNWLKSGKRVVTF